MRPFLFLLTAMIAASQTPIFISPVTYSTNGSSVTGPSTYFNVAADLNGDGRPDLIAPDNRVFNNANGFTVSLSTPNGYAAPAFFSAGTYTANVAAADFNNDGRADIVASGTATTVLISNGNGTFSAPAPVAMPFNFAYTAGANVTAADLNKDGFQDILVPGVTSLAVALGNGNGTFRAATLFPTSLQSAWVTTGDVNNDGNLDALVTISSTSPANVFLGNGDGTFQPYLLTLPLAFGAQLVDLNNDGKLDIIHQTAQARQDGSNYGISIALGLGNGSFQGYSNYIFSAPFRDIIVADFNNDGRPEVASFLNTTGKLTVFNNNNGVLGPVLFEAPVANGPFSLLATDVDANGSKDLVISSYSECNVFRNPRGNPPLLAQLTLNPPSVIGGAAASTATISLGNAASTPVTVSLASSDPAAFFPTGNTVTIPAGIATMSVNIATAAVAAPTAANITATLAGVTQSARLDVVPGFVLTGFSVNPGSQYGNLTATGTVTLNSPAASATVVTLISGNPAIAAVPAFVNVPAGATTVSFPITLAAVAANTAVNLSASLDGITQVATLTVLRPLDAVTITKAIYTAKSLQIKLDVTGTNATATLTAYNAITGALLGTLSNNGGRYSGTFTANLGATPRVTVKSSLGGNATATASLK
jgi:hypothetical protein